MNSQMLAPGIGGLWGKEVGRSEWVTVYTGEAERGSRKVIKGWRGQTICSAASSFYFIHFTTTKTKSFFTFNNSLST